MPTTVNFVAKAADLHSLGFRPNGSVSVALNHLSTGWLWEKICVQGGAYGASCNFDDTSGMFAYSSYRDPGLVSTLDAFDGSSSFLRAMTSATKSSRATSCAPSATWTTTSSPTRRDTVHGAPARRQHRRGSPAHARRDTAASAAMSLPSATRSRRWPRRVASSCSDRRRRSRRRPRSRAGLRDDPSDVSDDVFTLPSRERVNAGGACATPGAFTCSPHYGDCLGRSARRVRKPFAACPSSA